MLRIIVVPRDTIMIEKCEKLVTVLLKALFVVDCYCTLIIALGKFFVEMFNEELVLSQKMSFQPKLVNRLNYRFQQDRKLLHEPFQFFIERLSEKIIVQISHEMNQALLLRTVYGVIRSIKVRN